jgi:hypothetical protein
VDRVARGPVAAQLVIVVPWNVHLLRRPGRVQRVQPLQDALVKSPIDFCRRALFEQLLQSPVAKRGDRARKLIRLPAKL